MSDCCCGNKSAKKVLLYACSGGSNVGEAADIACRQLMNEGVGSMFCLAGLGAGIDSMVLQATAADLNVVIDGCSVDCAHKTFARLGLSNVHFVRAADIGLEKKPKGTSATLDEVKAIVDHVKRTLAFAQC